MKIRTTSGLLWLKCLLIALCGYGLLSVNVAVADSELKSLNDFNRALKGGQLSAQSRDNGSKKELPVIIALDAPPTQQIKRATQGWQNLDSYIEQIQSRAIADLGWKNFNDIVRYQTLPAMAKSINRREMQQLLDSDRVAHVFIDQVRTASLSESTQSIGLPDVLPQTGGGAGQVIAVLDTGVDANHPFLRGKVVGEACFSDNASCPNGQPVMEGKGAGAPCQADCSHGTHVAGIVAGLGNGFSGVAPEADLLAVQVFSVYDGYFVGASDSDVLQGLEWVYLQSDRHPVVAVNMSLGGGAFAEPCDELLPYKQIIDLLRDKGIATIVASGNESQPFSISAPACISSAISVGSLEKDQSISEFSNAYENLTLLAPGGDIRSAIPGQDYEAFSGTSMAAPHVAGAWALLKAAYPQATVNQIQKAITSVAQTRLDPRNDQRFPQLSLSESLDNLASSLGDTEPSDPKPRPGREKRIDGILIEAVDDASPAKTDEADFKW